MHYKRGTYLIERSPENIALARKQVIVREWEDGRVEIHAGGRALPYSLFDQNPVVSQGAVVENKRLGAVLSLIQVSQAKRDRKRMAAPVLTLRQKRRVVEKRETAGLETPLPLPPADEAKEDRLDSMLEYMKGFGEQQKERRRLYNAKAARRRLALAKP